MWTDSDAAGLRAADLVSAESSTRALRSRASALDHLPDGGFRVSAPNPAEAARSWRRERLAAGLCLFCPGPGPPDGGSACASCRIERAAQALALKVARRAAGFCSCGRRPVGGGKLCAKCLAVQAVRRARLAAAALCECGRTATPGFKTCGACRRRAADQRARTAAAGRCERCPAPARPGRVTCARCAGRPAARAAARRTLRSSRGPGTRRASAERCDGTILTEGGRDPSYGGDQTRGSCRELRSATGTTLSDDYRAGRGRRRDGADTTTRDARDGSRPVPGERPAVQEQRRGRDVREGDGHRAEPGRPRTNQDGVDGMQRRHSPSAAGRGAPVAGARVHAVAWTVQGPGDAEGPRWGRRAGPAGTPSGSSTGSAPRTTLRKPGKRSSRAGPSTSRPGSTRESRGETTRDARPSRPRRSPGAGSCQS